jgi:beta-mannosidase
MTLAPERHHLLDTGWQLRPSDPALSTQDNLDAATGWQPARVPGNVMQELLAAGRIPDPFFGCNEAAVQWVGEHDWCYRLDFHVDLATLAAHTDLVFDGLDTFARVWLNGELILQSDNMFVPHRVPVGPLLRDGSNRLAIVFDSALRRGRELEALHGRRPLWNGDTSRLYVRKVQAHYGWDWGPVLLAAGPWQPIRLHSHDLRIDELDTPVHLADDHGHARINLRTRLAGRLDGAAASAMLEHRLFDPQGRVVASTACAATAFSEASLPVPEPQLWWPAGHGAQPLYRLVTQLSSGGQVIAAAARRLGIRSLRLLQEPVAGEPGMSFHFQVNGKPLFMGGANWIPDDLLFNRLTPQRYRQRVQQAVDAHMGMLRVWGGGIYEDEAFYDACDELGVLVWQDFLFACGLYPAHEAFCRSVQQEAEAAVRRLRHRASLALWCGNNEDYALAESLAAPGPGEEPPRFDARVLYEELLPGVCAALDPQRPYWPGSPYSPGATGCAGARRSSDPTVGDRHSWEVWHGPMLPYQQYHTLQGRFVSEFGMQSHPSLALLESVLPEAERHPQSRTMAAHNKAGPTGAPDGHRRLAVYLADTLRAGPLLAEQVYATQFVQAEAMRYAYQDFRRRWQHDGARAVGGALVWQLNDCWPATSWALIDSAGVVKPAWYAVRRALAPLTVALRLAPGRAHGWVMSDRDDEQPLRLQLAAHALSGERVHEAAQDLQARANGSTDFEFALPPGLGPVVAQVTLHAGARCIAWDAAWPEPFRFHPLAPAGLSVQRDPAAGRLLLQAERPAKGVWLQAAGLRLEDNFVDLLPGQVLALQAQGDLAGPITVMALDQAVLHM